MSTPRFTAAELRNRAAGYLDALISRIEAADQKHAEDAERIETLEMMLRREWWLGHGHTGQYGDDGEMQCSACMPFGAYDYRRTPLDQLRDMVNVVRLERVSRALLQPVTREGDATPRAQEGK